MTGYCGGNDSSERIEEFKKYLKDESLEKVINKYLLFGTPFLFKDDEEKYFELKEDVARFFKVQQTQIFVVGSAKFGFSISPSKMYKKFDDESDIDVAVIDETTFNVYWKRLFDININLTSRSESDEKTYNQFLRYFFRGWLRPDLFPRQPKDEWFEYFASLHAKYGYKVNVGLYRDHEFFMNYHMKNFERIKGGLYGV